MKPVGPSGLSGRTETISGRQGLAPHCVFSVNLSTKAMTQVQQTIQPTNHHVTPAKLLGRLFACSPPFQMSTCEYLRSSCVDLNEDTKHGSVVFPRAIFVHFGEQSNLRRQQVGLDKG